METVRSRVDVLVVGGGTAGTIAAIQAARLGASTVLVELGSQLGGSMTTGGVSFPGLFHAWGRQVIAGIGWELVARAVELDGGTLPDFSVVPERHSRHHVRLNGPLYAALAEEACVSAGVDLAYYELPIEAAAQDDGWWVETVGKGQRRELQARQLIDATGDAALVGLLGLPRQREAEVQPGTLMFRVGGYDVEQLDAELIQQRYEAALADGRLRPGDFCHAGAPFAAFLRAGGTNAQHVFGADSSTAARHTAANLAGRRSVLRLLRFIRELPGCAGAKLLWMQPETAVRETYRIEGEVCITHADYVAGRVYDDAVCYAFYPIDLHHERGVEPAMLPPGVVPTVPLRALVPRGSRNLLVAGRCLSSDRLANSALRVQATAMATGQAAGAAAALAATMGVPPLGVPLERLRRTLREHGALLP